MIRYLQLLLGFFLTFATQLVLAADSFGVAAGTRGAISSEELFEASLTDPSREYLGMLFGSVGNVLTGTSGYLLGTVFYVFNIGILVVAGIFVVWGVSSTVLHSGHEGRFMAGKQGKPGMLILRTVAGFGLLVPSFNTGYSMIQVFVMWVVLQGVGFANTAWNQALDYFEAGGSALASPSSDVASVGNLVGTVYMSQVCMYFHEKLENDRRQRALEDSGLPGSWKDPVPRYRPKWIAWTGDTPPDYIKKIRRSEQREWNDAVIFPMERGNEDRDDGCGRISYRMPPDETDLPKDNRKTRITYAALRQMVTTLSDAARRTADPGLLPPSEVKSRVESAIVTAAGQWVGTTLLARTDPSNNPQLARFMEGARKQGWIFAGAYYYNLTSIQRQYDQENTIKLTYWKAPRGITGGFGTTPIGFGSAFNVQESELEDPEDLQELIQIYHDANYYVENATATVASVDEGKANMRPQGGSGINPILLLLMFPVYIGISAAVGAMQATTTDPILMLQQTGNILMTIMIIVWVIGTILVFVISVIASIMSSVNPVGYAIRDLLSWVVPILFGLLGMLFVQGAVLAVYVPMVPMIVYSFAAIGWFLQVLEAMAAAPLIALGLTHPEGHDLMGRSEQAVMLLLGVFLRPVLMVIGLIAGMILSRIALTYFNSAFLTLAAQYMSGPFNFVIVMFMYVGIVVVIVNTAYSAIHVLPDKIMRWIGGVAEATGAAGQQAMQAGEAGVKTAGQGMASMADAASKPIGSETAAHSKEFKAYADSKKDKGASADAGGGKFQGAKPSAGAGAAKAGGAGKGIKMGGHRGGKK